MAPDQRRLYSLFLKHLRPAAYVLYALAAITFIATAERFQRVDAIGSTWRGVRDARVRIPEAAAQSDHALGTQAGDVVRAVAQLRQHFVGVFTEQRRAGHVGGAV